MRDNRETGPLTLTELRTRSLFTTDLIWVEGESTCWKHPSEIPELKGLTLAVKEPPPRKIRQNVVLQENPSAVAEASARTPSRETFDAAGLFPEEVEALPSFEALKEKYAQNSPRKKAWKSQVSLGANLLGLLTLVIGLGLSAYMVKKAVENIEFDEPEFASANAIAIEPEKLPASAAAHAAYRGKLSTTENRQLVTDSAAMQTAHNGAAGAEPVKNASTDKVNAVSAPMLMQKNASGENTLVQAANEEEVPAKNAANKPEATFANNALAAVENEMTETKPAIEEKTEKSAGKPSLHLAANKYTVGLLGGISNLELLVSNPSATEISKAVVEVEYLRPNGKVVGSQTITVSGIAPGGSKTVSVPDNSRGVSVRYKVVRIES